MKRLKLIAAFAITLMVSGASFAQKGGIYVGTNGMGLGMSNTNLMTGVQFGDNHTAFGIAPEAGYFLTDQIAIGLGVGFKYEDINSNSETYFGINPYARYYFLQKDKFSLYGQLNIIYTTGGGNDYMEISVRPGVAYQLSDHFGINATFGAFGYFDATNDGWFGLNVNTNSLSFGITYSF